jgi:nitrate/TMAO reductase-like tetraheme cytochrome c subunit
VKFSLTVRGLTIGAIVLTIVVVVVGVALAGTSTAAFCGACKSHKPYIDELRASAHADVNCEQCHTKPGAFFFLTAKLEALQQPIHQITGDYEKPMLGTVLNQSCRRCHTDETLFKPIDEESGIRVQHRHLIEAGFLCIRCHSAEAHGEAVPEGSRNEPNMDQCLLCHNNEFVGSNGEVASAECDLCHTERDYAAVPATHDQEGWDTRHGSVGILSTCSACHDSESCTSCHRGVRMPHGDAWISSHGDRVERRADRRDCRMCHSRQYCLTCHQVAMPHPPGYISSHPQAASRTGTRTCFNCHQVDNCQACHEQHGRGDPPAHQLFDGVKFTPSPTPAPALSAAPAGP